MISESTIGYYKYRVSYMIDEVSVSFIDIEVVMEDINIIDVFTKEEYRSYLIIYLINIRIRDLC